ncbi:MAG: hypothetical protein COY98_02500 [Candidatus Yonathbacteria bacterium CG_4_10_14_0_8_um_filter_43_17]|uniref:Uncharacterized protein n=1 Tax=Candidatus Yonathbacteria bacterium CG_4_10_14_0_8_um_filter_43_17 TaxID=1975099 RepID=A0A2M7Q4C0_9BACT|nr:MAG: hypothetical protein COY98_02500 [Candidatus Yonathbacteria bacterium CG_4_10_14_0_8_um_filter_43_17]
MFRSIFWTEYTKDLIGDGIKMIGWHVPIPTFDFTPNRKKDYEKSRCGGILYVILSLNKFTDNNMSIFEKVIFKKFQRNLGH